MGPGGGLGDGGSGSGDGGGAGGGLGDDANRGGLDGHLHTPHSISLTTGTESGSCSEGQTNRILALAGLS